MIAAAFLIALGVYLAGGLAFAIPFVFTGVKRIDPHAAHGSWGFRLLIIPGTMVFWPLLLRRWIKGVPAPPEECNAHRHLAASGSRREDAHSKTRDGQSALASVAAKEKS